MGDSVYIKIVTAYFTRLSERDRDRRLLLIKVTVAFQVHESKVIELIYTGCNRRNGPNFGRVFLMLNYTEKTQNTYIQS